MASWRGCSTSATTASCLLLALLWAALRVPLTAALQSVPGSPCEALCSGAGDLEADVTCLDADYRTAEHGQAFESCVACQLNSTVVDPRNNETDVGWGLLALRYTLAGCMFAIPEPHVSISSPCQVSCANLNASIGYQFAPSRPPAMPGDEFCVAAPFADADVNRCAFCYSFIPQQLFLANFLQALHIACVQPPTPGQPFFPSANAIFNETLIAGPPPPSARRSGHRGLHGWQLGLAIALPVVGGILLMAGTCWGCFVFTRRRRQKMAQSGRMTRVHDAHADSLYSQMSVKATEAWGLAEPPREMHAISPTSLHAHHPSPGLAQGRWSHHGGATSEQGTPVRNSFQRDDVGPGTGQVRDPQLHEQYFGASNDPAPDLTDQNMASGGLEAAHRHATGAESSYAV